MTAAAPTSELERHYRDALRWYPRSWREKNEDAVLGTLLDQAEAEHRGLPAKGELANLRASAMRARFGVVDQVVPAAVRQRAATIALALAFTIAVAGIVSAVWQVSFLATHYPQFAQVGTIVNLGVAYYGLWVLALVLSLVGLRRLSMTAIIASLPTSIALPWASNVLHLWGSPGAVTMGFLDLLGVIYLLGAPRASRTYRASLAIISCGFLVSFVAIYWAKIAGYWGNGALGVDWFWGQYAVWLTFLGIPAVVVGAVILWRLRRSPWAPAILLAALPVLPLALVEFGYATTWLDNTAIAIAALVGVAILIGILRLFGLRIRITRT